ncbi:MAG: helix-turn-helix transcriptional regulator [Muribaculum sp.]|nr:helix-turn-helix transcriptional regulator [Muribaculum sp.]
MEKDNLFWTNEMTESNRKLHSPSCFARQNLLYVQEAGTLQSLQPHRCIREGLDSFLIMAVLEGEGTLDIAGEKIHIKAGDCAWIDCMQHYEHISDESAAWRLAWVHFNGQSARSFYNLYLKYNRNQNVVSISDLEEVEKIIIELREKQQERNPLTELGCGELLLHLVNVVLGKVANVFSLNSDSERQTAGELRNFINDQYVEANIIGLLTDEFSGNVNELNEIFNKEYGINVEEYIDNRRYNAAKELLRFSVKPMEDIARESGLGDITTMQKLFCENEGMPAEEYRRKWAGWVRN